jgi:FKBP-type peptidyl-prolyl cis-trans isomerase
VKKTLSIFIMAIVAVGLIVAATMLQAQDEAATAPEKTTPLSELKTTGCVCVYYEDLVEGTGQACEIGSSVEVHYTLWFADSTGAKIKRVQSSKDGKGLTFTCKLGENLIYGWSQGMVGMQEGGTRRLTIPPVLGYGIFGNREMGMPPNQWLVFEIELVKLVD